ncbi:MAG: hypothetical protein U5L96_18060 [Owenweeksia sp.]|nr:hypothetical protein [Owenweeksia sp.]
MPKKKASSLSLPFFDDFSADPQQPNATRWADKQVYISQTMPFAPPSLGAAVFDGLDEMVTPTTSTVSARIRYTPSLLYP